MKEKVYVVNWQNNDTMAFHSREKAIAEMEAILGKNVEDWSYDNGDDDEDGNVVVLFETDYRD